MGLVKVDFQTPTRLNRDDRINLRDVFLQLDVKNSSDHFAHWARRSLKMFQENQDYGFAAVGGGKSGKGRPAIDYWVTVETAKHIAMLSKTEAGAAVRRYFLECERLVMQHGLASQLNTDYILGMLKDATKALEQEQGLVRRLPKW